MGRYGCSRCDNVGLDAAVQGGPNAGEIRKAFESVYRELGFLEGHSKHLPPGLHFDIVHVRSQLAHAQKSSMVHKRC